VVFAVAVLVVAVSATVVGASERLRRAPSPSGARAPRAPTSTTVGFGGYAIDVPSPLRLYPGRPDAKYDDIEAHPNAPVSLGFLQVRVLAWSVGRHSSLPAASRPAQLGEYSGVGLVDGFAPSTTHDPGDVLRVTVRSTSFASALRCVAVAAADGTVLVPYAERRSPRPQATTSTLFEVGHHDVDYYLPLGTRRGRLYFTCDVPALVVADRRAVWGLDV
jgi:hypothetical protein